MQADLKTFLVDPRTGKFVSVVIALLVVFVMGRRLLQSVERRSSFPIPRGQPGAVA